MSRFHSAPGVLFNWAQLLEVPSTVSILPHICTMLLCAGVDSFGCNVTLLSPQMFAFHQVGALWPCYAPPPPPRCPLSRCSYFNTLFLVRPSFFRGKRNPTEQIVNCAGIPLTLYDSFGHPQVYNKWSAPFVTTPCDGTPTHSAGRKCCPASFLPHVVDRELVCTVGVR